MRGQFLKRIKAKAGGIFFPPPSIFDFLLAGILFVNLFQEEYKKRIFFVFYTIFLLCMTFLMKQKRDYKSIPLALFVLTGFMGIFTHSFLIYSESITFQYLNFYLLSEGFLYTLFGTIFLMIAVRYSKNFKFLFLLSPVIFYPYLQKIFSFKSVIQSVRFTIIFASVISFSLYCFLKKRYKVLVPILAGAGILILRYWDRIRLNFTCRPDLWKTLLLKIKEKPFLGHGFNKTFSPDNMTYHSYWGWLYNHNDYLALASYLGIFALILIVIFILSTARKIGLNIYLPIFLTLAIIPFFQMTMFDIDKAAGFLLMTALCITKTHFKEGIC